MKVLSFDIETKPIYQNDPDPKAGLNPDISEITVVCTYDGTQSRVYHLCKPAKTCVCRRQTKLRDECAACVVYHAENATALFAAMDSADRLCGYNCVRFDIAFLQKKFQLDNDRVSRWVYKCTDLFLFVSEVMGTYCKLDRLLKMNGLQTKSSSGKEAIQMAFSGMWDELADYCSLDAKLTHNLTMLQRIRVPAFGNTTTVVILQQPSHSWTIEQDGETKTPHRSQRRMLSRGTAVVNSLFDSP